MNEKDNTPEHSGAGWRLKLGICLFGLSVFTPLCGIPLVTVIGLSAAQTATISGVLLVGAEILGLIAVAVMGKDGYDFLKQRVVGLIRPYAPAKTVSRKRYTVGLVLFILPILFAWFSAYTAKFIPGFTNYPLLYAVGGDLMLLVSLYILAGDFWDKIRGLFIYDAKMHFSG
jgi:hypothetical protein